MNCNVLQKNNMLIISGNSTYLCKRYVQNADHAIVYAYRSNCNYASKRIKNLLNPSNSGGAEPIKNLLLLYKLTG